jgi:hypothetical protein
MFGLGLFVSIGYWIGGWRWDWGLRVRVDVREVRLSAIESDRISARSKKTRHRSLRTWIRGLISRYSRTAM